MLMLLVNILAPFGSKAQSNFTCSFENLDEEYVIESGSIVTATITYTYANVEAIKLTFPNTFEIINPPGGNYYDLLEGSSFGDVLPTGALRTFEFLVSSSPIVVTFAYRGCNVSGNSASVNTNNLFFDCSGGPTANINLYSADIVNPSSGIGLDLSTNQYAIALHSDLPPLELLSTTINPSNGVDGSTGFRIFKVKVNSLSIQAFNLNVSIEGDITTNSLKVIQGANETLLNSFNYGSQNLIELSSYNSFIVNNGNSRELTFRQDFTRDCIPNPNPLQTTVNAQVVNSNPLCNLFSEIAFNSITGGLSEIINVSSSLTLASGDPNVCSGNYNYDVTFRVNGPTSLLDAIEIPLITNSFALNNSNSISLVSGSNVYPVTYSNIGDIYTIQINDNFIQNFPWNGFVEMNGTNQGAWLDIPLNGSRDYTIRFSLSYVCQSGLECNDNPLSLAPVNNQIKLILRSTCLTEATRTSPIPPISFPNATTATVTGGCVPFDIDLGSVTTANFSYLINLPSQNPFLIGNTNCSETRYRAVLSVIFPASNTLLAANSISTLSINGFLYTGVIDFAGGNLSFDLPEPEPGQATNYQINFQLINIDCDFSGATFGSYQFRLTAQAICSDCIPNLCVKNFGCATDLLFVHCAGDCSGTVVGTESGLTIKRSTFGWASSEDYANNLLPITSDVYFDNLSPAIDAEGKEEQLKRLYPYDIFTLNAEGEISASSNGQQHDWVGFRMDYTENATLGNDFFELIDFDIVFTQGGITYTFNNSSSSVPFVLLNPATGQLPPPGLPNSMFQNEFRWNSSDLKNATNDILDINVGVWEMHFTARFRVTATSPAIPNGLYPVDFLCQFISAFIPVGNPSINTSCDPYGANILVLIPEVQVQQQSIQAYNSGTPFNDLVNTNSVGPLLPNNACSFYRIVGLRHLGGLGDNVDDFPYEFRPLSVWPMQVQSANLEAVNDLFSSPNNYNNNSNQGTFVNNNSGTPLLPATEKGEILDDFQGLILRLNRNCPNSTIGYPAQSAVPLNMAINQYAYIHPNFDFVLPNTQPSSTNVDPASIPNTWGPNPIHLGSFIGLEGNDFTTIPLQNGANPFEFQLYSGNYLVDVRLRAVIPGTYNPIPNSPISFTNFQHNGSLVTTLSPDNWFRFNNGMGGYPGMGVNNASFTINLGVDPITGLAGCFSDAFEILFEVRYFCEVNSTCSTIFRTTRKFKRATTSIANVIIANNFQQNGCNLIWNLNVTNQSQIPIDISTLNLNFATGLMYQSGSVSMSGCTNPQPNLSLASPDFNFVSASGNSSIETTLDILDESGAPILLLQPQCTLNYSLTFSTTNAICDQDFSLNNLEIITADFTYSNLCNDDFDIAPDDNTDGLMKIDIDVNTALSQIMETLSDESNGTVCCINSPLVVQHQCGPIPGSISYTNTDLENSVIVTLFINGLAQPPINVPAGAQMDAISVETGTYGVTIQNTGSEAFFTEIVIIQDHGFIATLTNPPPVCSGSPVLLTPVMDPVSSTSEDYTFLWPNNETTESIIVTTIINNTIYEVEVSNGIGYCTSIASAAISLIPLPTPPIITANWPTTFCAGNGGVNLISNYTTGNQWLLNGNNIANATNLFYPVLTESGNYSVSYTDANGCSSTSALTLVTINPIPSAPNTVNFSLCQGSIAAPLSAIGENLLWYTNLSGGTGQSAAFTPNTSSPGSTTYYVSQTVNGCESARAALQVTINSTINPSVSLQASAMIFNGSYIPVENNTVCFGTSIALNANTPGITNPTFNWAYTINGVIQTYTTTSNILSISSLNNIASISVSMTSSTECASSPAPVTANIIILVENPPEVTITAFPSNICAGQSVTLNANSEGTGTAPEYAWFVNGVDMGVGTSTYTTNTLSNNDQVVVIMDPNVTCPNSSFNSDLITMQVNPILSPTVSLTSKMGNSPNTVCAGSPVTFTANSTNGGTNPIYEFRINNVPVQNSTSNTFTTSFSDNPPVQLISVIMTSNAICPSPLSVNSNSIIIYVNPLPSVFISPAIPPSICNGSSTQLTATGGTSYSWSPSVGLSDPSVHNPTASPTETTNYIVSVTAANGCTNAASKLVTVNPLPVLNTNTNGNLDDVYICSNAINGQLGIDPLLADGLNPANFNFSWSPNFYFEPGYTFTDALPYISPTSNTLYSLTVQDNITGCSATTTQQVYLLPEIVNAAITSNNGFSACGGTDTYCSPDNTLIFIQSIEGVGYTTLLNQNIIQLDPIHQNCISVNWTLFNNIYTGSGGEIMFLVTNNPDACIRQSVLKIVNPCCSTMTTVTSSNSESVNNVGSFWLPPSQIGSGGTRQFVGATFSIDAIGDVFNATTNIEFVNCFIALSAGNKIKLAANKNITLINTEIRNCTTRHNGIDAIAGGNHVTITDSKISGGNTGVSIKSGTLVINNSQFNRNITHVRGELSSVTVDGGSYKKSGNIPGPYSGGPQPCNFAFTLNKCGTAKIYNVAEISDAGFGIKIIYGSLDCQGTSFKNCSAGIDLWNSPNTNLATDKPCYIGSGGNNPIPNSFDNCKRAIRAGGKLVPCNISENNFNNSIDYAIKVEYLRGRAMTITNNYIDNSKIGIYSYLNSTNSYNNSPINNTKLISGNVITANAINYDNIDINYDFRGILVEELALSSANNLPSTGTNAPNNNLRILDNTLYDCRHGIDLYCCNGPEVNNNVVYVNSTIHGVYSPAGVPIDFCHGIGVTGCYNSKIQSNVVNSTPPHPYDWAGWFQTGIRVAASPESNVCNNIVSETGTHPLRSNAATLEIGTPFEFHGNCNPSVFKLNNIRSTVRGLYMGGMPIGGGINGVIIGNQGSINNPRNNDWLDVGSGYHTDFNNVNGFLNSFFMTYSASSFNNSMFGGFSFQSSVTNAGFETTPCNVVPRIEDEDEAIKKYTDIAKDSVQNLGGTVFSRFLGKEFLYSKIKDEQDLENFISLAQFKDSADIANLKFIDEIKRGLVYPLDSIKVLQLYAKLIELLPANEVEQHYKEVYEMALFNPELKDSIYSDLQIEKLKDIAQMCPFEKGNSVYMARVILHAFDMHKDYYNTCEIAKNPKRTSNERKGIIEDDEKLVVLMDTVEFFSVFPNPNKGIFQLICPTNSSFKYELVSPTGQLIKLGSIQNAKNNVDFDFSNISKGIYYLKIITTSKSISLKISIN